MRLAKTIGVALLVGSTALAFALPANSAPLMSAQAGLSKAAPSSTETVQYWHRHGYGHYHGGGGAGALIGGLAAGAITALVVTVVITPFAKSKPSKP